MEKSKTENYLLVTLYSIFGTFPLNPRFLYICDEAGIILLHIFF